MSNYQQSEETDPTMQPDDPPHRGDPNRGGERHETPYHPYPSPMHSGAHRSTQSESGHYYHHPYYPPFTHHPYSHYSTPTESRYQAEYPYLPPPVHPSPQSEPWRPHQSRHSPTMHEALHDAHYTARHFDNHYRDWEERFDHSEAYSRHQYDHSHQQYDHSHQQSEAFASCATGYFAGTTPPQIGDSYEHPRSVDSREHYHGPFKSEGLSLNAKEGYDSPDGYCKSTEESPDASVPTNISFPNHDAVDYTPYESPVSALNHAHHDEPPQLPEFHRAETNRSDVANSSSNSSSHDTSATSEGWMRHFNSLVRYKEAHGDCDVPQKHKEGEDNLGVWVNKQRMERRKLNRGKKSSMSPQRLQKLNGLGFNWGKEKGQASWDQKYKELCDFKEVHGHCMVKTKDKVYKTLGRWVTSQRYDYKNDRLTPDKIQMLDAIGFCWAVFDQDKDI